MRKCPTKLRAGPEFLRRKSIIQLTLGAILHHHFSAEDIRNHYHGPARKPLRTASEMAAEFGLSHQQLRGHMQRSTENPPKPEMFTRGRRPAVWYVPDDVRAWWKRHKLANGLHFSEGGYNSSADKPPTTT